MSIEAMRQALEALDGLSEPYDVLKAQNALRAAIEQSEKQEPVAWVCSDESLTHKGYSRFSRTCEGAWNIPVYTAPRQWQGLTDEEITKAGHLNVEGERMLPYSFARAIEARLKEKNV